MEPTNIPELLDGKVILRVDYVLWHDGWNDQELHRKVADFEACPDVVTLVGRDGYRISRKHLPKLKKWLVLQREAKVAGEARRERIAIAAVRRQAKIDRDGFPRKVKLIGANRVSVTLSCSFTPGRHVFKIRASSAKRAWEKLGSVVTPLVTIAGELRCNHAITDIVHGAAWVTFRCPTLTAELTNAEIVTLVEQIAPTLDFSTLQRRGPRGGCDASRIEGWTPAKDAGLTPVIGLECVPTHDWFNGYQKGRQTAVPVILADAFRAEIARLMLL